MDDSLKNQILSSLPKEEYKRLSPYLKPVELSLNDILLRPQHKLEKLYFPTKGIVSLLSEMKNGSTTEIGIIGSEGVVGIFPFLGGGISKNQSIVQSKGTAMQVSREALQSEYDKNGILPKLLLSYSLKLFNQVSQCAACNNHHSVQQRIARWILMLDDRNEQETLLMTQQLLSKMLGVRRTGVTKIAKELKRQEIIEYHRGRIKILNRQSLESIACECYQVIRK